MPILVLPPARPGTVWAIRGCCRNGCRIGVSMTYPLLQKLGFLALVAAMAVTCAAQTAPAPKPKSHTAPTAVSRKGSAAKKVPEPAPVILEVPPSPPPPSRPYEMSPVPPQVTFEGGQLTISAPNSTLADILSQVRARTGTKIDFPASAAQERVALQLGPGTPRDVLSQLLHGSPFDYFLLGSEQDPSAVTQIVLTRREAGPANTSATAAGNRPNQAPVQSEPDEDAENETAVQPAQPQPLAQPTPGQTVPGQPAQQPLAGPGAMPQAPEQNAPTGQVNPQPGPPNPAATPGQTPGQNEVKTPEQLLQQLQQMQREEQLRRQRPPR
jgi:outer membrane biosynthesis protein TonB